MLHLRWMIRRDVPSVLALDEYQTEQRLLKQLAQRDCIGMVVENQGSEEVVGYMVYRLHETSIEVLNMVGDDALNLMVNKLKEKIFSNSRRTNFTVPFRGDNIDALNTLKNCGMIATDIFHGEEHDVYRFVFQKEWELCTA